MALYPCKICGKLFERVGNGVYCSGPHYRKCVVCGKEFEYVRPSDPRRCCSKECIEVMSISSKQRNFGYRKCKECGKEFLPKNDTQLYCEGPHKSVCVICGKEFEYTVRPSEKPQTCSRTCKTKLQSDTYFAATGYRNPSSNPEIQAKLSESHKSEDVRSKTVKTLLERTGYDSPFKIPEVRARIDAIEQDPEFKKHMFDSYKARTGYDNPMSNPEVLARRKATNLERYNREGHIYSREEFMKKMIDPSKVDNYLAFKDDPVIYIRAHYTEKPGIDQLEQDLGVTNTPIYDILCKFNCSDLILHNYSTMESQVERFILSIVPDANIIKRDRTVIKPLELDLYLPEYKIAFECNPAFTHNSSVLDPWGSDPKDYKYHQYKSLKAQEAGVFLFHIFGYEWENRRSIIESMIRNLLHKNSSSYGARETYICELSSNECKQFLSDNHRQGPTACSVRLGLRLRSTDELVSVMTFGKIRPTIGKSHSTQASDWELSRFCNKLNTSVAGSASKLFKYFIKHHCPSKVISFSDVAHTKGELYNILGFKSSEISTPSYVWTTMYDNIYYNRVSCQKSNLKKLLKDDSIDIVNHTEKEIMEAHNFVRVYDSGTIRWEYIPVSA